MYAPSGARLKQWNLFTTDPNPAMQTQARKYAYDSQNRLVQAGEWTGLAYDKNNRLIRAEGFGLVDTLAHDAYGNNISSVSTGNVPGGMANFTFDSRFMLENRLPHMALNGGTLDCFSNSFGETYRMAPAVSDYDHTMMLAWDDLGRLSAAEQSWTWAIQR